jgi:hypothetical protein
VDADLATLAGRELTGPVALCDDAGGLDARAVGWSRRPLQRCNLRGSWLRKKRWDYWCVVTPDVLVALVRADLDWLAFESVHVLDLASGAAVDAVLPRRPGAAFAERAPDGEPIRLALRTRRVDLALEIAPAGESLNVVVPFARQRFQFTSKQLGLAARGRLSVDGRARTLDGAWAALDFGRGIWPHRTRWRWAVGCGGADAGAVAFNLGGEWTRGTGATENALFIAGRLHKLAEEVEFSDGRIDSPRVALRFTPRHRRRVGRDQWPLGARLDWACGTWNGTLRGDGGETIVVRDLFGWCESFRAHW